MSSHDDEARELREQVEKLKAENARLDEFCMGCLEKIGNQQMLLARVKDELQGVSALFETINKEINGEPWENGIEGNSEGLEGKYAECLIKIDRYEQDRAKSDFDKSLFDFGKIRRMFVDYKPCEGCTNPDTYGEICVKCGACGRKFDDKGVLIDDEP